MAKTKIKTGEGLEVMKDELKIPWLRDLQDNENRQTFKNIGVGGDLTIVESQNGQTIVENKHGTKFTVTGKGLTRRIMRLFTKSEEDEINNTLPRA